MAGQPTTACSPEVAAQAQAIATDSTTVAEATKDAAHPAGQDIVYGIAPENGAAKSDTEHVFHLCAAVSPLKDKTVNSGTVTEAYTQNAIRINQADRDGTEAVRIHDHAVNSPTGFRRLTWRSWAQGKRLTAHQILTGAGRKLNVAFWPRPDRQVLAAAAQIAAVLQPTRCGHCKSGHSFDVSRTSWQND